MTDSPLPFIQHYENFDLLIDPMVDGYQVRVIHSPVGQAITQFSLDESVSDQSDPKQVGTLLYQAVFSGEVGICLRRSLDAVAQQPNNGLRIRLRLTAVLFGAFCTNTTCPLSGPRSARTAFADCVAAASTRVD